jgi:hypothetical protein
MLNRLEGRDMTGTERGKFKTPNRIRGNNILGHEYLAKVWRRAVRVKKTWMTKR